jgi:5-methylcytosine-specific restriction endonuclease McrA
MSDTLVLDVGYLPVDRVSWERAITLIYEQKAEVVEDYDNWNVHSATLEFPVPSVIRRMTSSSRRKKGIKFSRGNVYARDGGRCQYCGNDVPKDRFTYDHVIPRVSGGKTCWENVVISCTPCNQRKGGRTPTEAGMKLLSKPIRPKTLPGGMTFTIQYREGMPDAWRKWVRDKAYWNVELEQD